MVAVARVLRARASTFRSGAERSTRLGSFHVRKKARRGGPLEFSGERGLRLPRAGFAFVSW